jgi:SHAQKYF class myb-like DNA-binding protein
LKTVNKTNDRRYWTEEEHQRFLDALQSVGPKDVKAIASFVGSRSATQVRTHAQKYFLKLVRNRFNFFIDKLLAHDS